MKKILLLALTINAFSFCLVQAQNPVPNPSFENWTSGNPDNWLTSNVAGIIVPITQVQPGHSGTYAVKGQAQNYMGNVVPPILASTDASANGFPVTMSYTNFTFSYKFNQVAGDVLNATVAFIDANSAGTGTATIDINTTATAFTTVNVPITNTGGTPATCIIEFVINDQSGSGTPNVGSYFIIDDVSLNGATVIPFISSTSNEINVFPKPASQFANISFNTKNENSQQFELYDVNGNKVDTYNFDCKKGINTQKIDVTNFKNGLYFLRSTEGSKGTAVVVMH